ncbi:MAG: DNA methyltransferase [Elioraea sp.]|nr:DNA methyltransferase [Elioraea sp.]
MGSPPSDHSSRKSPRSVPAVRTPRAENGSSISSTAGWTTSARPSDALADQHGRRRGRGNGTQKPVECMRRPIVNNSAPGEAVYEPFCGSGSSIIAAETTGRVCYALDTDRRYVDVAVRRWQVFTGHAAVLAGADQVFDDIARRRHPDTMAA